MTMLATTFLLLTFLAATQANEIPETPECTVPPTPPSLLPSLPDCLMVVNAIAVITRMKRDVPQVWSRAPLLPGHGIKLPSSFSSPAESNRCEVVIDTINDDVMDTFPMNSIWSAVGVLVNECLIQHGTERPTLGTVKVGPKKVVVLRLRKKVRAGIGAGVGNTVVRFNGTEVVLTEGALGGGIDTKLVE